MKPYKKLAILSISLLTATSALFSGCLFKTEYLPTFTSEYFDYAVQTKLNGEQEGYLIGFTELALQQK